MQFLQEAFDVATGVDVQAPGKPKSYYIQGIFIQAERENRNGRIYPLHIVSREVEKYTLNYIQERRAFGELGHPENPCINLDRVCHVVTSLEMRGNDVYGKAKILDTPYGKVAKALIDENLKLGVSTRGIGSVVPRHGIDYVQDDFLLTAVDTVHDPSAPDAFVDAIMEGKSWILEGYTEKQILESKKRIDEAVRQREEEYALKLWNNFLVNLSKK